MSRSDRQELALDLRELKSSSRRIREVLAKQSEVQLHWCAEQLRRLQAIDRIVEALSREIEAVYPKEACE